VQVWYESIARATVVSAHGGVCRALMALLEVKQPSEASMGDVGQGCVYLFNGTAMTRHG
jgi:probable phosphoglycerate mutase